MKRFRASQPRMSMEGNETILHRGSIAIGHSAARFGSDRLVGDGVADDWGHACRQVESFSAAAPVGLFLEQPWNFNRAFSVASH